MDPNSGRIYTPGEIENLDKETRKQLVYGDAMKVRKLVRRMKVKRKPPSDAGVVKRTKRKRLPA